MNEKPVPSPPAKETSAVRAPVKDVFATPLATMGGRAANGRATILEAGTPATRERSARCRPRRQTANALLGSMGMVAALFCSPAAAQQTAFDSYQHVQRNVFWQELYACGGTTLYCGLPFLTGQKSVGGRGLTIEHVYPADWIATHHGCDNRKSCKAKAYGRAAADLHNLWPAVGNINSSRQDQSLGEIPGERHRRFQEFCPDYERTKGQDAIVEPRDAVKGDMARSILYMLDSYHLPLPANMERDTLLRWHEQDPPDDMERWRNLAIKGLQQTVNPYIR